MLGVTAITVACGPTLLGEADQQAILNWLACDECIAGERAAVSALGENAVPYLLQVLDSVPAQITVPLQNRLTNQWSQQLHPDQSQYVNSFLENARTKARIRAARSLGDLGASNALGDALTMAIARGYRPAVIAAIRGELDAIDNPTTAVATIRVVPSPHTIQVGQSLKLGVFVEDAHSNLQPQAVTWTTSSPSVVNVDASGVIHAIVPGSATITARSTVNPNVSGSSAVTVIPVGAAALVVRDSTGSGQPPGAPGFTLPDTFRIVVRDAASAPVAGVTVTWRVLLGGGTVTPQESGGRGGGTPGVTNAAGVAAATWQLGPPGPQRLEARVTGSPAVVFRARSN